MGGHERVLVGGEPLTTNNRMELTAVLEGLRALKRPCRVRAHVDSRYVMDAFAKAWIAGWQRNGWLTAGKQPVKNRDLWEALAAEVARHEVHWVKVKGHDGVALNERVDQLACGQRDKFLVASGGIG